jgi:predicted nucleic acid-binding protein
MTSLAGSTLYLDSNVLIYALESRSVWNESATRLLKQGSRGRCVMMTGDAAMAEVLVGVHRAPQPTGVEEVQALFASPLVTVASHSHEAFRAAALIRGTVGGQLIDALHLATAIEAGCDAVISHDARMPHLPQMPVLRLDELDLGE